MESRTLLITGVSGYIGGSVLSAILRTKETWAANLKISALVRSESQATKVRELGVSPELFSSFDELDRLEEVGKGFDIIIHAGAGWHTPSAQALIRGQGVRRETTNADVHYIQISGTSNLSDRPYTEGYIDTHVFSDDEDIYSYEKYRESRETYFQRTTDIAVIEESEASGVTTYILPTMIADALRTGSCSVVSEGDTVWNHVHIEDLAALHLVLLQHIFRGIKIPSGRKGIYFCETGEHSHLEFSEYLAKAGHKLGVFPSSEVAKITIQEAGEKWVFGNTSSAELGFASNSRTKAVLARNLGWAPSDAEEWESTFSTELNEFIKNPPSGREIPKYLKK
ncbi:NAD dependent epimerase/dehydratase family protein [Aspergillus costaricaensis CBS 115574]|uniref:NAD dependent epimerase/dehydratase family protein n=1 Tax=Aspergillus costaricaensis CBS 115574 TaxID=1448317 RepID=A0ACD1I557_9EURO|nr:NAD dependent epimerase/dehydratase family protein [Aspergillus costaricaensis CBS 115574]RAK85132.1 NAD dependent epimerase/dehydratase family protein [Aspergillus costaricaensis CBS 115574]